MKEFSRLFGISSWSGWTYDLDYLPQRTYRGKPATWVSKVAIPAYGPSMEIIVSGGGPSVFSEFLEAHGPGLHHIGFFVPSMAEACAAMAAEGHEPVETGGGHGVEGDGEFVVFDLTDTFGSYLELIEPPALRYPPHFTIRI